MSKYELESVRINGAICGHMWMPNSMGSSGYRQVDVENVLARFSDSSDATMRDVVLHTLMENGGDFQDARFAADTDIVITRVRRLGTMNHATHSRVIPLAKWADCADLVHADVYASDFE